MPGLDGGALDYFKLLKKAQPIELETLKKELVVSEPIYIDEGEASILGLNVYPNPTDEELNIAFNVANDETIQLTVQDVSGKQLLSNTIKALSGSNHVLVDTKDLANGMYFIRLNSGNSSRVVQFVVK